MKIIGGKFKGYRIVTSVRGVPNFKSRPTEASVRKNLFNILDSWASTNHSISMRDKFANMSFLDLFCGTGACGIEALSRGFKRVYFVDKSASSVKLAKYNLQNIFGNIGDVDKIGGKSIDAQRAFLVKDDGCKLNVLKDAIKKENHDRSIDRIHGLNENIDLLNSNLLSSDCESNSLLHLDYLDLFDVIYIDPPFEQLPSLLPSTLLAILSQNFLAKNGIIIVESGKSIAAILNSITGILNNFSIFDERRYGNVFLTFLRI